MKDIIVKFLTSMDSGFVFNEDKEVAGFEAEIFASRKGKNFVFPQRDYFYFFDADRITLNTDTVKLIHEAVRTAVNSEIKTPKALRFSVPNIASIFYTKNYFPGEIIDLARQNTRSIVGGEIQQIFLIDLNKKLLHCQGTNTVSGNFEGVRLNMEFKKIDPQNRSFYLFKKLTESL